MRILVAVGEKLEIGFYEPRESRPKSGWGVAPEDFVLDGEITVRFSPGAITVAANMEDSSGRGGETDPIIYQEVFSTGPGTVVDEPVREHDQEE